MSDRTPPPDLIDKLAGIRTFVWNDDAPPEVAKIRRYLQEISEWADGGLIDTTTWQRINAEQVDTETIQDDLSGCPYYARWGSLPGHDPEASCYADCHSEPSCVTDEPTGGWPLRRGVFTLTPKENR